MMRSLYDGGGCGGGDAGLPCGFSDGICAPG